ncbi:hypothetical protein Tco_0172607 [Tanacetum coccineum]
MYCLSLDSPSPSPQPNQGHSSLNHIDLDIDMENLNMKGMKGHFALDALYPPHNDVSVEYEAQGSKKAKTFETTSHGTSDSTHGGLNLNEKANDLREEVREVRPMGQDRAKKKVTPSSTRFESLFVARGDLVELVSNKWKSIKSVGWGKRRNNKNLIYS